MSAFYVGAGHMDAMLSIVHAMDLKNGAGPQFDEKFFTEIGKRLLAENIKSLRARYPRDWFTMVEGDLNSYKFRPNSYAVKVLKCEDFRKLWECYSYQSCEHAGWEKSEAYKIVAHCLKLLDNGKDSAVWHYRLKA